MMKKIISLLLIFTILVSLTACGKATQQDAGRRRTEDEENLELNADDSNRREESKTT